MVCFPEHVTFDQQSEGSENAEKSVQGKLRDHPLFFAVTLGLLAEVINSR